ncbi:type IV secretory system conjugative DNA transfer family protein [Notoacmeibacter marinus]|uniref:type IV secretory system conjugative DNA transfer family protein n=1 Tax=Notoacmeibacter marinus TaxID=1876515 RepID=UPI001F0A2415|nr:type IV secretory system conjugative DNA transfer family protein [Notoacmeibacter marinus]
MSFDGRPIFEPRPSHSLLLAAAGGGKTTCGALPWLLSMLADGSRAIVVMDSKDGEIAAQAAALCARAGRKVAILDDFAVLEGIWGEANPYRIALAPFGGLIAAHERGQDEMIFASDSANHALIEEPAGDAKNQYWRDEPRTILEYAQATLLNRNPALAIPGAIWSLIADTEMLSNAARIDIEEGNETLATLARLVLEMQGNEEHFPQHRAAALKALRIFGAGSPLHRAGSGADTTHLELLRQRAVIFIVGPQRHMERLGPYYALHLQSFMDAILGGSMTRGAGAVDLILDEFTNAPLKELVSRLTTMRGYGGRAHMIAQSRSEIQRRYGEKETLTIEENGVVKQWFGFSSFEEAERVSKAMGEAQNVAHSVSVSSGNQDLSSSLQTGRERLYTPDELMCLPGDEQIIHVKDVGFIHAKKIRQNEIAPWCFDLGDNPLEGARLTPDPKLTLGTGDQGAKR